ncbi:MAG: ABC transporter permease subunit [Candidatus Methanofastidiosia archaeon]
MRITIHNLKNSWKGMLLLNLSFIVLAVMVITIYPTIKGSLGMQDYINNLPEPFLAMFGRSGLDITTVEGYLNTELYQWGWVLLLGVYFAFISSSLISREIENKTIDMLLSNPVSRGRVLLENFLGLAPAIILINITTPLAILGCARYINESIDTSYLFYTHLASIPYLLAACALGLLFSVIFDEVRKANTLAIGTVFGMYIIEALSLLSEKYSVIGKISFTHYYDPGRILIQHNMDITGMTVLSFLTAVFLVIAILYFQRKDIAVV